MLDESQDGRIRIASDLREAGLEAKYRSMVGARAGTFQAQKTSVLTRQMGQNTF